MGYGSVIRVEMNYEELSFELFRGDYVYGKFSFLTDMSQGTFVSVHDTFEFKIRTYWLNSVYRIYKHDRDVGRIFFNWNLKEDCRFQYDNGEKFRITFSSNQLEFNLYDIKNNHLLKFHRKTQLGMSFQVIFLMEDTKIRIPIELIVYCVFVIFLLIPLLLMDA